MKVYLAEYCACIYESSFEALSIHADKQGAEAAIAAHKAEETKSMKKSNLDVSGMEWRVRCMKVKA
jgi:hypothetical protein